MNEGTQPTPTVIPSSSVANPAGPALLPAEDVRATGVVSPDPADLVTWIEESIRNGFCILFLGAATHSPPPDGSPFVYPESERPRLGGPFTRDLVRECGYPESDIWNLQRVAWEYEQSFNRPRLEQRVRQAVEQDKRPSPLLRALARIDFPIIITTNYDTLFEQALQSHGKAPLVSVYSPRSDVATRGPERRLDPRRPFLLKLHGDVNNPNSIVITEEDYIHFLCRMGDKKPYHPVPQALDGFLHSHDILFIGYSLRDYNLRLIFRTLRWNDDPASRGDTISIDRFPDARIQRLYETRENLVRFIVQDMWTVVPELHRRLTGEAMLP